MVSFGLLGCLTTHLKALSITHKTMIPSDLEIRAIGSLTKVAKFCKISQNKTQCFIWLNVLIFNWSWQGRLSSLLTWFSQILIGNILLSSSCHSQYYLQSFLSSLFEFSSVQLMTFRYHILYFFWELSGTKVEQEPDIIIYFSIFDHSLLLHSRYENTKSSCLKLPRARLQLFETWLVEFVFHNPDQIL